jgi:protein-disulfide isomerase
MTRSRSIAAFALLLIAGLAALPALAQEQDMKADIEALKKGQQEILQQLQEMKKLLQGQAQAQARPAGPNVKDVVFDMGDNPVRGSSTAKLTLIEFTDYQ